MASTLLWPLSACFSVAEPPDGFFAEEEVSEDEQEDAAAEAPSATDAQQNGNTSEDVAASPEDTSTPEDTESAPEPEDTDTTSTPEDTETEAQCGGVDKPSNTCVEWSCSNAEWVEKTPLEDGSPCESACYVSSGPLTCQGGECRPQQGESTDECEDTNPNECIITACDHALGTCTDEAFDLGASCDDGDACTTGDTCSDTGACSGEAKVCADEDAFECTTFSCNPESGECEQQIEEDTCLLILTVGQEQTKACWDAGERPTGNSCKTCNPASSQEEWSLDEVGDACQGLPCKGEGTCTAEGLCDTPEEPLEGYCFHQGKCVVEDTALFTNKCEICDGESQTMVEKGCDDDNPCTADSCDSETGECTNTQTPNDTLEVCNGLDDDCDGTIDENFNLCSPSNPASDGSTACIPIGEPNPDIACQVCREAEGDAAPSFGLAAEGAICDTGLSCTLMGQCLGGTCIAEPDTESSACSCCVSNIYVQPGCNDDEVQEAVCELDPYCCAEEGNWDDLCALTASELGTCGDSLTCNDGLANEYELDSETCGTIDQFKAECTTDGECDDGNPCSVDICSMLFVRGDEDTPTYTVGGHCLHLPAEVLNQSPADCDDGDLCNGSADTCVMGICTPTEGEALNCDDGFPCTINDCDPTSGCTTTTDNAACDDTVDCTVDSCDSLTGCVHTPNDDNCAGNQVCDKDSGCTYVALEGPQYNCCTPHEAAGCNDVEVMERVCASEDYQYCCSVQWNPTCAAEAADPMVESPCGPSTCDDNHCNYYEALRGCHTAGQGGGNFPNDCQTHTNPMQCGPNGSSGGCAGGCLDPDSCAYTTPVAYNPQTFSSASENPWFCIRMDPALLGSGGEDCDDGLACSMDSCNPETLTCAHDISGCEGVGECIADSECTYMGCEATCSGSLSCEYDPDTLCDADCKIPDTGFSEAAQKGLAPSQFTGGFLIHNDFAFVASYTESGIESGLLIDVLELSPDSITTTNIGLNGVGYWTEADFGLSDGFLGGMFGMSVVRSIHGRDGWIDFGFGTEMAGEMPGNGAFLCSVEVSDAMDNIAPDPSECGESMTIGVGLYQDDQADEITAMASTDTHLILAVGTPYPYDVNASDTNYLVSLPLDGEGKASSSVATPFSDQLTSNAIDELTYVLPSEPNPVKGPSFPLGYFSPREIKVHDNANGANSLLIVAGQKYFDDDWDEFTISNSPSYAYKGGALLFGSVDPAGDMTLFDNYYDSEDLYDDAMEQGAGFSNDLPDYEPVEIKVDSRNDTTRVFTLWAPLSTYGVYCGDSGDEYACESLLTVHEISGTGTPINVKVSPAYDEAQTMQQGYMSMTLVGAPEGGSRVALGAGSLYAVGYEYANDGGFSADGKDLVLDSSRTTLALERYGSNLFWLTRQPANFGDYMEMRTYKIECEGATEE